MVGVELLLLPTAHGAFLHLCARPLFAGAPAPPPSPAALLLFSPMSTVLFHWLAGAPARSDEHPCVLACMRMPAGITDKTTFTACESRDKGFAVRL